MAHQNSSSTVIKYVEVRGGSALNGAELSMPMTSAVVSVWWRDFVYVDQPKVLIGMQPTIVTQRCSSSLVFTLEAFLKYALIWYKKPEIVMTKSPKKSWQSPFSDNIFYKLLDHGWGLKNAPSTVGRLWWVNNSLCIKQQQVSWIILVRAPLFSRQRR